MALIAAVVALSSTAYCQAGVMADGTYTRPGSVAMDALPLHVRIRASRSPYGPRRRFTVRDRIGFGSQLDFFVPSCARARQWGRRTVLVHVL